MEKGPIKSDVNTKVLPNWRGDKIICESLKAKPLFVVKAKFIRLRGGYTKKSGRVSRL